MSLTLIQKILSRLRKFRKKLSRANTHESFCNHVKMSMFQFVCDLIIHLGPVIYTPRTRDKYPEFKERHQKFPFTRMNSKLIGCKNSSSGC